MYENRGRKKKGESKKEREKERKWKHVCEKTHQGDKMGIVHVVKQNQAPRLAAFVLKGQEKAEFTKQKFGDLQV